METISRKTAKAAGLKHYFTGKPCKRGGHIDLRYVASFSCMTCQREKAFQTFRNLDAQKREARREYERNRWKDPKFRQQARHYARQEKEILKKSIRNREWKRENRSSCTDREHRRRALFLNGFVEDVSLEYLFDRDKGVCQLCRGVLSMNTRWPNPKAPTRDHIVPLSKGGTHERSNLQLACAECNVRKSNRCA